MSFDELFNHNVEFKDCKLVENEKDQVAIKTRVNSTNTNPYGKAHGGYLFTLCDTLCGLLGYNLGSYVVTSQANINYLKPASLNDELLFKARALHNGGRLVVAEVEAINQNNEMILKAQFTLFKTAKVDIK